MIKITALSAFKCLDHIKVHLILDTAGYQGNAILQKHILDNSCGDGAFLCEIVHRYCEIALRNGYNIEQLQIADIR